MAIGDPYAAALLAVGKTLEAVEAALDRLPDGTNLTTDSLKRLCRDHRPTTDQLLVATSALTAIEVLVPRGETLTFNAAALRSSTAFRWGVRAGIGAIQTELPAQLLAALPAPFDSTHLTSSFWDLRAALMDLIASAASHLLLASPFWDEETAEELRVVLQRKLSQGVSIELVGRQLQPSTPGTNALADLVSRLGGEGKVHAVAWMHRSPGGFDGVQTFHFKCAIADHGSRAYLGSANFTSSGLRSRAELGVLLRPPLSAELYELVHLMVASRSR